MAKFTAFTFLCLLYSAAAFTMKTKAIAPNCFAFNSIQITKPSMKQGQGQGQGELSSCYFLQTNPNDEKAVTRKNPITSITKAISVMGGIWGAAAVVPMTYALDDMDGVEIAELPPPYVPILFALALVAGVGLLTGSLGDVIGEEASLGNMSGAKAKKEMERSRSSYFKK